jgi:hypothetical protein
MVWDSTDGYVLLFGGEYLNATLSRYVYYNDTWSFLDGHWTNLTTTHSPPERTGASLADDPADHEVILFGGESPHGVRLNDTWAWSAGVWTNITHGAAPPAGYWASMAYDGATSSVLLFGGANSTSDYGNDTWSFSAGTWTQLFPAALPPGRDAQEMAYDAADSEMVMFGGNGQVSYLNDTWTYSGSTWSPIAAGPHPGARVGPGVTYDSSVGNIVLYGGNPAPFDYYATWLFSGGRWTEYNVSNSPPNPSNPWAQMVYDPTDNYVVLFYEPQSLETYMDTWTLTIVAGPPTVSASLSVQPSTIALGQSVTISAHATGGTGVYAYAYSTLPAGCASQNLSSIPCTPTAAGSYTVGVNVTDTESNHAAATASLTVTKTAVVTLTAVLTANPGTVYVNQTTELIVTTAGVPASGLTYLYSALPGGCTTVDSAFLNCTPTVVGVFHPTVEVHDSAGHFANSTTVLNVAGSGPPSSSSSLWIWIVIVVVIIAAILLLALVLRRRRKETPADAPTATSTTSAGAPPPPPGSGLPPLG